jgi:hypothetical protein
VVRLFWNPARVSMRAWVLTAAAIWVFVKLPQEWWIHIAQLDFTDTLAEVPWFGTAIVAALLLLGLIWWFAVRPRQPARDWSWHVAADTLPAEAVTVTARNRWVAAHGRLMSVGTLEKVVLVGLLFLIYAQVLPGVETTSGQLFLGTATFVMVNCAVSFWVARSARGVESAPAALGVRVLMNLGLVMLAGWLAARGGGDLNGANALFFVLLLSLLTFLDDRYRPIYELRFALAHPAAPPASPATTPPSA